MSVSGIFYLLKSVCEWDVLPSKKALLKELSKSEAAERGLQESSRELKKAQDSPKRELKGGGEESSRESSREEGEPHQLSL